MPVPGRSAVRKHQQSPVHRRHRRPRNSRDRQARAAVGGSLPGGQNASVSWFRYSNTVTRLAVESQWMRPSRSVVPTAQCEHGRRTGQIQAEAGTRDQITHTDRLPSARPVRAPPRHSRTESAGTSRACSTGGRGGEVHRASGGQRGGRTEAGARRDAETARFPREFRRVRRSSGAIIGCSTLGVSLGRLGVNLGGPWDPWQSRASARSTKSSVQQNSGSRAGERQVLHRDARSERA